MDVLEIMLMFVCFTWTSAKHFQCIVVVEQMCPQLVFSRLLTEASAMVIEFSLSVERNDASSRPV